MVSYTQKNVLLLPLLQSQNLISPLLTICNPAGACHILNLINKYQYLIINSILGLSNIGKFMCNE